MPAPVIGGLITSVGGGLLQAGAEKRAASNAAREARVGGRKSNDALKASFEQVKTILAPYTSAGEGSLQASLALLGYGGTAAQAGTAPAITPIGGGSGRRGKKRPPTGFMVGDKTFTTINEAKAYANANLTGAKPAVTDQEAQAAAIERVKSGSQFQELAAQGEYGIMANAAATGGLRGGNTQAALAQFRPAMLQALITQQLSNLGGITAVGGNAAGALSNAASGVGTNMASNALGVGQAGQQAAIATGQANSNAIGGISGALGNAFGSLKDVGSGAGLFGSKWAF